MNQNNNDKLAKIRKSIYQIIEMKPASSGNMDISMDQKMNLALSNAVKKDGVNIIQLQNMEIIQATISNAMDAIRILDEIQFAPNVIDVVPQEEPDDAIPFESIKELLITFIRNGITYKDFISAMKRAYVLCAISEFPTKKDAAICLDLSYNSMLNVEKDALKDSNAKNLLKED